MKDPLCHITNGYSSYDWLTYDVSENVVGVKKTSKTAVYHYLVIKLSAYNQYFENSVLTEFIWVNSLFPTVGALERHYIFIIFFFCISVFYYFNTFNNITNI